MDLKQLREPFKSTDIEWRIGSSGIKDNKPWGMCLAYVTARAIQDRLDDVCGAENWQNDFKEAPQGGVLCGISIWVNDRWVIKWNGSDNTNIEAVKGGLSGAEKRAGAEWGIGRYLYNLDSGWAVFNNNGKHSAKIDNKYYKWDAPDLPLWALPKGTQPKKQEPKQDKPLDRQKAILAIEDEMQKVGKSMEYRDDVRVMFDKAKTRGDFTKILNDIRSS